MEKENLINDLFWISKELETLWAYHPDNPQGSNLVKTYNELKTKMSEIEGRLKKLNQ